MEVFDHPLPPRGGGLLASREAGYAAAIARRPMRSPADMRIIQIDITNACPKRCSNCTRFCGHHAEPFFMDYDTFRKAVDSMKGYSGIVGLMGGEPTIHPQFEKFLEYYRDHVGYDDLST